MTNEQKHSNDVKTWNISFVVNIRKTERTKERKKDRCQRITSTNNIVNKLYENIFQASAND